MELFGTHCYAITLNGDLSGYVVTNKRTGVVELEAGEYPKCLVYVKQGTEIIEGVEGEAMEEVSSIIA